MYINTCMSYALMLFEELFASQLSVPSSPVHPIKCTTVQMKKKCRNGRENESERKRENEKQRNSGNTERGRIIRTKKKLQKRDMYSIEQNTTRHVCFSQIAPCIHSSHNDLFLFWNQFFRICQECISTDSI